MSKLTTAKNPNTQLRVSERRDLMSQNLAITAKPFTTQIVGISKKGLGVLSLLALLGFGHNLYQTNQEMKATISSIQERNLQMEQSLLQKEKIIASQDQAIEKLKHQSTSRGAGAVSDVPSVQVINNISVPGYAAAPEPVQKKTNDKEIARQPASVGRSAAKDYEYKAVVTREQVDLNYRQLPLDQYVNAVNMGSAKDYADVLHKITIERNRFSRDQRADHELFVDNHMITGRDELKWHRFREKQSADRIQLDRMFKRLSEGYRNKERVSYSRYKR